MTASTLAPVARWYDVAKAHPSAVLLIVQVAGIVAYPFLGDQPWAGRCSG